MLLDDVKSIIDKKHSLADAQTNDKGHGRMESRQIWVSDETRLYDCIDFPHVLQVFKVKRMVSSVERGTPKQREEVVYGVTSLPPEEASPKRLLELIRGHWEIENRVHYVRDFTYDEDRCRIRTNNGPQVMASIRNLAISIVRMMGFKSLPDAHRVFTFCSNRIKAFERLGIW